MARRWSPPFPLPRRLWPLPAQGGVAPLDSHVLLRHPVLHYELHTPLCVYPTSLRSITIGLFTALSYIGEVVAPLDIDYALYKLSNQDTAFFAMGFVTLDGEKQIHNILY